MSSAPGAPLTRELGRLPGGCRGLLRRAFVDSMPHPSVRYRHGGTWSELPPRVLTAGGERLIIIVPTLAPVRGLGSLPRALARLCASIARLISDQAAAPPACALAVVMQDRAGEERRTEGIENIERQWTEMSEVPCVGISVSLPSKLLALNCCLPLFDVNGATCVAWFDDDVEVDEKCLLALWTAFAPSFEGIYGARKVAVEDRSSFSSRWARFKNRGEPVNLYPHGCAILLSRRVFGDGIPLRYITDDHYYLFRFLDASASDPLELLRVVPDSVVRVPMINDPLTALRRIARNYRNVQRVLADTPADAVRYFRRTLLLPGLRPPRTPGELVSAAYWTKLGVHTAKGCFWLLVQAEMLARGFLGRPLRSVWYSASPPRVMSTPARMA